MELKLFERDIKRKLYLTKEISVLFVATINLLEL